jgi:hypothetical protein
MPPAPGDRMPPGTDGSDESDLDEGSDSDDSGSTTP